MVYISIRAALCHAIVLRAKLLCTNQLYNLLHITYGLAMQQVCRCQSAGEHVQFRWLHHRCHLKTCCAANLLVVLPTTSVSTDSETTALIFTSLHDERSNH